ncbi:ubie coq5 [Diaporthe eres]|nr:ubie coq5 [Diaporthe eres]
MLQLAPSEKHSVAFGLWFPGSGHKTEEGEQNWYAEHINRDPVIIPEAKAADLRLSCSRRPWKANIAAELGGLVEPQHTSPITMAYQNKALVSDDPNVLALYEYRTAKDYAAYLLRHLKPDFHILDVGCGPGGMTHDFSLLVPQGKVVAIDVSPDIVVRAAATYQEANLSFEVGDAYELSQSADASFAVVMLTPGKSSDVIHAHALFMHLTDPVKAFKAMYRVVKPGGIVASRDSSGRGIIAVHPDRPPFTALMTEASPAQLRCLEAMGSWTKAGVYKEKWAREAGEWNGFRGAIGDRAVELGVVTREQVERWGEIWSEWIKEEDRFQKREFVDTLCFKGEGA